LPGVRRQVIAEPHRKKSRANPAATVTARTAIYNEEFVAGSNAAASATRAPDVWLQRDKAALGGILFSARGY
jgi:hypothetical protein